MELRFARKGGLVGFGLGEGAAGDWSWVGDCVGVSVTEELWWAARGGEAGEKGWW